MVARAGQSSPGAARVSVRGRFLSSCQRCTAVASYDRANFGKSDMRVMWVVWSLLLSNDFMSSASRITSTGVLFLPGSEVWVRGSQSLPSSWLFVGCTSTAWRIAIADRQFDSRWACVWSPGRGVWGDGERSTLVWPSVPVVFTNWSIRSARFAGPLKPGDRP